MYCPRVEDLTVLRQIQNGGGLRTLIISGSPGVGKTSFAHFLAAELRGSVEYFLGHSWVTEEDLFLRVDPARVAGLAGGLLQEMEDAYRPGVLLRAVERSLQGPVVLLLDEWDKTQERCDALLLDFLQTGEVHGPFGQVWKGNLANLVIVITTNQMRPLAEPLLRRGFRYAMPFLPPNVEGQILRQETGASPGALRVVMGMLQTIRTRGASSPSLQEATRLLLACREAGSAQEVQFLLTGFLCKEEEDQAALTAAFKSPGDLLWGELQRKEVRS